MSERAADDDGGSARRPGGAGGAAAGPSGVSVHQGWGVVKDLFGLFFGFGGEVSWAGRMALVGLLPHAATSRSARGDVRGS